MYLQIRPVTDQNRAEILSLRVKRGQEHFIESTVQCLAEADKLSVWRPVGIYDQDTLVGFAMYGLFMDYPPNGRVWLDRLLIGDPFQGKGYGKAALHILIQRLWEEYHYPEIYLSLFAGNDAAEHLYQSFGFAYIGEKDTGGEDVMRLCLPIDSCVPSPLE